MDDHRFDNLARSLATGASRRRLLRGLAGGAAAAFLGAIGAGRLAAQGTIQPGGECTADSQCSQTGGAVVCADNGIATDGALNCCRNQGGACATGSGCCGALKCSNGVCTSAAGALPLGAACTADVECSQVGGPVVCADNGLPFDGPRNCCRNAGGACTASTHCCAGLSCGANQTCTTGTPPPPPSGTLPLGAACTETSQCAQPGTGGAVVCADNGIATDGALNCCRNAGGACTAGANCCAGFLCVAGICSSSTPPPPPPPAGLPLGSSCTSASQCDQTGGAVVCADNGIATDGAFNCCRNAGGACTTANNSASCCGALLCVNGVCGGTTSPPPPPPGALPLGSACTSASQCDQTGGAVVCADNGIATDGALNCCRNAGGACTTANNSASCCGALLCVNGVCGGTTSPPPPPGGTVAPAGVCTATSQCAQPGAGGYVCANNGYDNDGALNCCHNAGGSCDPARFGADCCAALLCVNGVCGGTTSPPPPPSGTLPLGSACTATSQCDQTGGPVVCADNGLTTDGALNCCRNAGGACTAANNSASCCGGLLCVNGVCGGTTSPPPPAGGTVAPGGACTATSQCQQPGAGGYVCADNGYATDGALNCCHYQGGACNAAGNSADCCGGLYCRGGTCQP